MCVYFSTNVLCMTYDCVIKCSNWDTLQVKRYPRFKSVNKVLPEVDILMQLKDHHSFESYSTKLRNTYFKLNLMPLRMELHLEVCAICINQTLMSTGDLAWKFSSTLPLPQTTACLLVPSHVEMTSPQWYAWTAWIWLIGLIVLRLVVRLMWSLTSGHPEESQEMMTVLLESVRLGVLLVLNRMTSLIQVRKKGK